MRRTNDELVAGWGNLVNRTANMIAKSFGEIPAAGELDRRGPGAARHRRGRRSRVVGELIGGTARRRRSPRRCGPWPRSTSTSPTARPGSSRATTSATGSATILHVTAQAVADCNLLLAPFLPHSANAVDRVLGGTGEIAPMPEIREVEDLDGGPGYPILTGEYSGIPAWRRRPVVAGTPVAKPAPVFTKLDPSVVDDELARLQE